MSFLIVLACSLAGLFAGMILGWMHPGAFGLLIGAVLGLLLLRLNELGRRLALFERRLRAREQQPVAVAASAAAADRRADAAPVAATPPAPESGEATLIDTLPGLPPLPAPRPPAPPAPPLPAGPPPTPPSPAAAAAPRAARDGDGDGGNAFLRWLGQGNVPVRLGVLVLFVGVAALLKYASDQGWLQVPIAMRLLGIDAAALAALALGWRERERRREFGLALQGGALGLLLLTVFAAFRLYALLPTPGAFLLLLVLVAAAGILAAVQDAMALALLGLVAGFAAPILLTTGGDHVALFAWYAVLDLAIFALAWRKSWPALNLMGFFATYAIGTAWGVLRYEPALLGSTAPFLAIFFATYLAIPLLDARRGGAAGRITAPLVLGNPLFAFLALAALLEGARSALALAALAGALLHGLLWFLHRTRAGALAEAFAAIAAGFATLAIPLAFGAFTTAGAFALEGAGLVWLGLRQRSRLQHLAGLALQLVAAIAFLAAQPSTQVEPWPLANPTWLTAALIAGAGLFSAWRHALAGTGPDRVLPLYLWGLAWWFAAAAREIAVHASPATRPAAWLAFFAITSLAAAWAGARTRLAAPVWTAAAALALALLPTLAFGPAGLLPHSLPGLAAVAVLAGAGGMALHLLRAEGARPVAFAHVGWLWVWTVLACQLLAQLAAQAGWAPGWRAGLGLLPLAGIWWLALQHPGWIARPLGARLAAHRAALLASQAFVGGLAMAFLLLHPGDAGPLPWLPLANPVELLQLALLACGARWLADPGSPEGLRNQRLPLLAAAGFAFLSVATLRAVHQLGGVPWSEALWSSGIAQTSLSVVWSMLGLAACVHGSHKAQRPIWLLGALALGLVLAKLLLVDRLHLGNLFGIGSFIAYGLLCVLVGYLAPAPPPARAPSAAQ